LKHTESAGSPGGWELSASSERFRPPAVPVLDTEARACATHTLTPERAIGARRENLRGVQFGIDEARAGERVVLTVRGEVDMATAPRLRAAFERAAGAAEVRVDMRAVEFMDSTGLSALVAAHQALARLVIVCPPGPGRRALEVSGLMSLLEIVEN
jgi:anti-sigma B factor antagonist